MRARLAWLTAISGLFLTTLGFAQTDIPAQDPPNPEAIGVEIDQQLDRIQVELTQVDSELDQVRTQSDLVRRRMMARGHAYYRLVHAGQLPFGAGFQNLVNYASKTERLKRSLEKDADATRTLNQKRLALLERRQKLVDRKLPLEMQQRAISEARAALMEADDRRRAFDKAFDSGSGGSSYIAIYGANPTAQGPSSANDTPPMPSTGFTSLKGRLPLPVAGRTEVRVVRRPGAGGPGVEIKAAAGAPVRAVFAGRVAFADDYSVYGLVVLVDHGDNYFTVYGNLAKADVRVGEEISAGAKLGSVGKIDGKSALYFEIRKGADTLDPSPWLGL